MDLVAGVDEVGRGSLAGPVIACAVILPKHHSIKGLRDSKKLSKKKREALFPQIQEQAISIGVGESDLECIDRHNIREATFMAMKSALGKLSPKPDKALIDGVKLDNVKIPNIGIVGGDDKIESIMAASIVAKVTRDQIMIKYSKIFPEFGFEKNSGYGTKFHIDALEAYKATPIHRESFRPVTKRMPTIQWLIEKNRVNWLGNKIAGMYIHNKGYHILKLENNNKISGLSKIEASLNGKSIYFFIFTQALVDPKKIQTHHMISEKIRLTKKLIIGDPQQSSLYRFDLILVTLRSNKQSKITKHIKNIA